MPYKPDPAASTAAATLARCLAYRDGATADLEAARAELARLEVSKPAPFDVAAAQAALADAQARDAIEGSKDAETLARQQAEAADAIGKRVAAHAQALTAATEAVQTCTLALEGADRVTAEALAASKACTARAARAALAEARTRYRRAVLEMIDKVSDVAALETLAQLDRWPDSRALDVTVGSIDVPGLKAFSHEDHATLADMAATFEGGFADRVRLVGGAARVAAMNDLRDIRQQLEGGAA